MAEAFDPYYKWFGISPHERPVDYYRLLGIYRFESDGDVIANAVDQRMAYTKTFQAGQHSQRSQQILNELAAAKVILLNPGKKAKYDDQLRRRAEGAATADGSFLRNGQFWQMTATLAVALVLGAALVSFLLSKGRYEKRTSTDSAQTAGLIGDTVAPAEGRHAADRPSADDLPGVEPALPAIEEPATYGHDFEHTRGERAADRATDIATAEQRPIDAGTIEIRTTRLHPQMRAAEDLESASETDAAKTPGGTVPDGPGTVHLDDLEEADFVVGPGTLGKHGSSGFPPSEQRYGRRLVFQGETPAHALALWPPADGASYVVYRLKNGFGTLRTTATVLGPNRLNKAALEADPLFLGRAYSPLRFKVIGDGKLLWQSRPLQTSGDWQDCIVPVENVEWLELHVECPGANAFAWAAWIDPRLSR